MPSLVCASHVQMLRPCHSRPGFESNPRPFTACHPSLSLPHFLSNFFKKHKKSTVTSTCDIYKIYFQVWWSYFVFHHVWLASMLLACLASAHGGGQTAHCLWKEFTQAHDFFPFYFIPSDVGRAVHAPAHITEKVVQLFRSKSEFTFLASIQQKSSTSGVIFSIHESEHR